MTIQEHFEKWLKEEHFPEADIAQRNGQYVNSTTRLMWVGWLARDGMAKKQIALLKQAAELVSGHKFHLTPEGCRWEFQVLQPAEGE